MSYELILQKNFTESIVIHHRRTKRIGGVLVSIFVWSVIDRGSELWSDQTINYKTVLCCFSGKIVSLRRMGKDWLAPSGETSLPRTVVSVS